MSDLGRTSPPAASLAVVWEGLQFSHLSLALVNRELCRELIGSGRVELTLVTPEAARPGPAADPRLASLAARLGQPARRPAEVHVRHEWPTNLEPPPEGHWVMIQPWELGSLPKAWIEPMNAQAAEVWVPSRYVRECFIRSGVRGSKVVVIPNGVDPARFRPDAPPLWLPTDKRFKFLFVGGTLIRKGIDILLETYLTTFRPRDDVCLVIKDFGTNSMYRGQGLRDEILRLRADRRNPELLYLDALLPTAAMPGLYAACDCLVHPYRGEGFGLPIAEAMACGRPVIVPDHGACLDFCDPSVATLVPASEVRLPDRSVGDLETVDQLWWAEVDRAALARAMRRAVEQPEQGRELGRRASAKIRRDVTWARAAESVLRRLDALAGRPRGAPDREAEVS